ncbi:hypothetical protein QFC19_006776 [Naganishia cerealis]|uniref:Uncharacterized protein n=1 Tax=Naganishia cerealis TaxID=610337 RepID=A0ACC2VFR1_9TREE|nr:hypothetical protein QFC19_006776 [Naganishia cerealis]
MSPPKPRNPLQELPVAAVSRPAPPSSSSGTAPSSVSSLLGSGGSRSATGTGSRRVLHLPLGPDADDSSSRRTIRPSTTSTATHRLSTISGETMTTRRWPVRGSSPTFSSAGTTMLTPGRLPPPASFHQPSQHSQNTTTTMAASSPLRPRDVHTGPPSTGRPSGGARRGKEWMMHELDCPAAVDDDADEEREEDDTMEMAPLPVPGTTSRNHSRALGTSSTPVRSPARRLFTGPTTPSASTKGRASASSSTPTAAASGQAGKGKHRASAEAATLQPSPPLLPPTPTPTSGEKTKSRARTSTGRESPFLPSSPVPASGSSSLKPPPPPTAAAAAAAEAEEQRGKRPRVIEPVPDTLSEEEQIIKKRMENADPHDCGFTVWLDTEGRSRTSRSGDGERSTISTTTATATTTMEEKNKKGFEWLSAISGSAPSSSFSSSFSSSSSSASASSSAAAASAGDTENQENIKPRRMVPFMLKVDAGMCEGKPTATGPARSGSGSGSIASGSGSRAVGTTSASISSMAMTPPPPPLPSTTTSSTSRPVVPPLPRSLVPVPTNSIGRTGESNIRSSIRTPFVTPSTSVIVGASGAVNAITGGNNNIFPSSRSAPVDLTTARPVLVLRRTGSAGNVDSTTTTVATMPAGTIPTSAVSGTLDGNTTSKEQENNVPSLLLGGGGGEGEKQRSLKTGGRKKRKSEEMMVSATVKSDRDDNNNDGNGSVEPVKKKLQTSPVGGQAAGVTTTTQVRKRRPATRRSLGSSTGSGSSGRERNSTGGGGGGGKGKKIPPMTIKAKEEDGYQGRVLRSMTRAGNGLR